MRARSSLRAGKWPRRRLRGPPGTAAPWLLCSLGSLSETQTLHGFLAHTPSLPHLGSCTKDDRFPPRKLHLALPAFHQPSATETTFAANRTSHRAHGMVPHSLCQQDHLVPPHCSGRKAVKPILRGVTLLNTLNKAPISCLSSCTDPQLW